MFQVCQQPASSLYLDDFDSSEFSDKVLSDMEGSPHGLYNGGWAGPLQM